MSLLATTPRHDVVEVDAEHGVDDEVPPQHAQALHVHVVSVHQLCVFNIEADADSLESAEHGNHQLENHLRYKRCKHLGLVRHICIFNQLS